MNAYELSEKLHKAVNNDEKHLTLDIEAMLMLRQQADRIAELEKQLAILEGEYPEPTINAKIKEFNSLEAAYNSITELEKDLHMIQRHYDQLDHDTTPQIKELSDEEILELTKDSTIFEYREFDDDMVRFARAILKKASEK